jgi:hypothetical protein
MIKDCNSEMEEPMPPTHIGIVARLPGLTLGFTLLLATLAAGCESDIVEPPDDLQLRELGVVVTSTDLSLTIFDVDDPTVIQTVGLGPDGSPVTIAARGRLAAVPMGIVPAVAVVDLVDASVLRTVALPPGSGATGVAFVNDSIVLVASTDLGTVSPVNVLSGQVMPEITVGAFPQGIVVVEGTAYVINANLVNFAPAGPASITVIDGATLQVTGQIELSGENAAQGAAGPDGLLYVIQSGSFGMSDGALSVVNLSTRTESSYVTGFGDFPGSVAVDGQSFVYSGQFGVGMTVWDAMAASFVRGTDNAVQPGGVPSTSGIGVDSAGRIYALTPDCQNPAVVHRLAADFTAELSIPVGICPFGIAFTQVAGS